MEMVDQFQSDAARKTSKLLLEVEQNVFEVVDHLVFNTMKLEVRAIDADTKKLTKNTLPSSFFLKLGNLLIQFFYVGRLFSCMTTTYSMR